MSPYWKTFAFDAPARDPLAALELRVLDADVGGVVLAPLAVGRGAHAVGPQPRERDRRVVGAVERVDRVEVARDVVELEDVVAVGELVVREAEALAPVGGLVRARVRRLEVRGVGTPFGDQVVEARAGRHARRAERHVDPARGVAIQKVDVVVELRAVDAVADLDGRVLEDARVHRVVDALFLRHAPARRDRVHLGHAIHEHDEAQRGALGRAQVAPAARADVLRVRPHDHADDALPAELIGDGLVDRAKGRGGERRRRRALGPIQGDLLRVGLVLGRRAVAVRPAHERHRELRDAREIRHTLDGVRVLEMDGPDRIDLVGRRLRDGLRRLERRRLHVLRRCWACSSPARGTSPPKATRIGNHRGRRCRRFEMRPLFRRRAVKHFSPRVSARSVELPEE